tara:strand:- start:146 stop:565 length:420 start_codon:yes stop_codon:yes gene_type:complete
VDLTPFHLAIQVTDLKKCRRFYKDVLGCTEGRSSENWVDFNFFGHQLVIHKVTDSQQDKNINFVDGKSVPVPHFGVVLEWENWNDLANKLKNSNLEFIIEPYIRFKGKTGEQATMFFTDPSDNALEFKAFKYPSQLFKK